MAEGDVLETAHLAASGVGTADDNVSGSHQKPLSFTPASRATASMGNCQTPIGADEIVSTLTRTPRPGATTPGLVSDAGAARFQPSPDPKAGCNRMTKRMM